MFRRAGVGMIALACLALASPADASANPNPYFRDFANFCMPGLLSPCMSFRATLEYGLTMYGAAETLVSFEYANHQGWDTYDPAWAFGIDYFHFSNIAYDGSFPDSRPPPGGYGVGGGEPWATEIFVSPSGGGSWDLYYAGQANFQLFGCDIVENGLSRPGNTCNGYQHTAPTSFGGRIAFTPETTLSVYGQDESMVGTFERIGCTVGVTCVDVPEPGSLVLMLTGVFGLALMARGRREDLWT